MIPIPSQKWWGGVSPNLLHNWDFRNKDSIVNQRGSNEYHGDSSLPYSIDRWRIGNYQKVALNDGYVTMTRTAISGNQYFGQYIEFPQKYIGMQITISIIYRTSRDIYRLSVNTSVGEMSSDIIPASSEWTLFSYTFVMPELSTTMNFRIQDVAASLGIAEVGQSIDIAAAKVEVGDTSTLLNDPPMEYGTELAKCQRYYVTMKNINMIIPGNTNASGNFYGAIALPVNMRTTPAIAYQTSAGALRTIDGLVSISNIVITFYRMFANIIMVTSNTSSLNLSKNIPATLGLSDAALTFSADI